MILKNLKNLSVVMLFCLILQNNVGFCVVLWGMLESISDGVAELLQSSVVKVAEFILSKIVLKNVK